MLLFLQNTHVVPTCRAGPFQKLKKQSDLGVGRLKGKYWCTPPPFIAAVLCRCCSSGSPSRVRAAPLRPASQPPLPPTTPTSQHTIFTGLRSQTPRPNQTPMTYLRSPGLSMRVGVSTRAVAAEMKTLLCGKHEPGWICEAPLETANVRLCTSSQ